MRVGDLLGAVAEARRGRRARRSGPTVAGEAPLPLPSATAATGSPSGRSSRDFSSTSRRAAVFLPTPGTRHRAATSSSARTRRSASGWWTERMARASAGPDAVGADQRLEAGALVAAGEAEQRLGVLADVVVGPHEDLGAHVAEPGRGERPGLHPVADAGHLDQHLAGGAALDQRAPQRSDRAHQRCPVAAARPAGASGRGPGGRGRARRRRPRRPGGAARPGRAAVCTMRCTASLSAAPSPATASFTSLGEYWTTSAPAATASTMASPLAWPDRHGGAHVHLEEHPLDGDDVGPGLAQQDPQLGLELGQPERAAASAGRCGGRRCAVQRGPRAAGPRRRRSRSGTGPGRCRGRTPVRR